jgi:hypothetical protein
MYRSILYVRYSFLLIYKMFCDLSLLQEKIYCIVYCPLRYALETHVHKTTYGPLTDMAL